MHYAKHLLLYILYDLIVQYYLVHISLPAELAATGGIDTAGVDQ
jgi:hypothetical protein